MFQVRALIGQASIVERFPIQVCNWQWWILSMQVNELRAAIGPLTGRLEQFADDACLKRYLRARNWNHKKSEKMLKDSLAWRESYKPEEIRWVSWRFVTFGFYY
jgi:hypothetical protein